MAQVTPNREDRIAARLAKMAGVALSAEDRDDDQEGDLDAAKLLRRLLRALGVEVAAPSDGELAELAAQKICELRSGRGAINKQQGVNPLIPGGAEQEPLYMSLTDQLRAERERLLVAKHEADVALAMAPPPKLSAEAERRLVAEFARRMGAVPEQGGASLSMTNEDQLADLLVARMPAGATGRPRSA